MKNKNKHNNSAVNTAAGAKKENDTISFTAQNPVNEPTAEELAKAELTETFGKDTEVEDANGESLSDSLSKCIAEFGETPHKEKTVIAPGAKIEGNLCIDGDMEISGLVKGDASASGNLLLHTNMEGNVSGDSVVLDLCKVHGTVCAADTVWIKSGSEVNGDVKARKIFCDGTIIGNILVEESVELGEASHFQGDMKAKTAMIHYGAHLHGKVEIG